MDAQMIKRQARNCNRAQTLGATPGLNEMTTLRRLSPQATFGLVVPTILAMIFVVIASISAQASTYFVATNGNDANAGTIGSPWLTMLHAVAQLLPGDTLYLRGGTYTGSANSINTAAGTVASGAPGNVITIGAYGGTATAPGTYGPSAAAEVVILQSPNGLPPLNIFTAVQYVVFQDLILDGVNQVTDVGSALINLGGNSSHLTFLRLEVNGHGGVMFGVGFGASTFNTVRSGNIHGNGVAGGAETNGHGLYISSGNNLVELNSIHDNQGYGMQLYTNVGPKTISNNTIRKNKVYNNGLHGGTAYGIAVAWGDSNLVYDNLVYGHVTGNGGGGILVYSYSTNAAIYNNTIYGNSYDGITLQYYDSSAKTLLQNNIIDANGGTAIHDLGDLNGAVGNYTAAQNLLTDPGFANAGAADFHLTSGSTTAIAQGATIAAVPDDFDGVVRPQGFYDIGAYQHIVAGTAPSLPTDLQITLT